MTSPTDYPALRKLMKQSRIEYKKCEICKKSIYSENEIINLYVDHHHKEKCIFAHGHCIQVNCIYCGKSIPNISFSLKSGVAIGFYPAYPQSGNITFAHPRCVRH